jgi:hypothetical protein
MIMHSQALRQGARVFLTCGLVSISAAQLFAFFSRPERLAERVRAVKILMRLANLHSCNGCNAAATVQSTCDEWLSNGKRWLILISATLQRLQRDILASYMRPRARVWGFLPVLSRTRVALQLLQCCNNENMYIFSYTYTLQQCCNTGLATSTECCRNGNSSALSMRYVVFALKKAIKNVRKWIQVRIGRQHEPV